MAVGVTNYPAALDDPDSLVRAANNATTTLSVGMADATGTGAITVASTAAFGASGTLAIEGEILTYTAKTATTFTGIARATEGTTGAAHANGTAVVGTETALHHTVHANALIAVQTKVGSGASVPATNRVLTGTGAGTSAWSAPPYDIPGGFGDAKPLAGQADRMIVSRPFSIASGASGDAYAVVGATLSAVFTIYRNGASIGTITFAAGGQAAAQIGTVSITAPVNFARGDRYICQAPGTQDATLSAVQYTLLGTVT